MKETANHNYLKGLDYSVLQQCMHCGMCLPTCPTYVETGMEKNSPRGRIALMRSVADGELEVSKAFADEMYYCLGCLACTTACPAGVDYTHLFEMARAESERSGVLRSFRRDFIRGILIRFLFTRPRLLRFAGRLLWLHQASGFESMVRRFGLVKLLPRRLRELEPMAPRVCRRFSHQLIRPVEIPSGKPRFRVGLLTGCVQDLTFSDVNRDTVDVLLANGCEVRTPPVQPCCGSLHGHNGDWEAAKTLARRLIDLFDPESLDAILTNAAGCGSHLRHYDRLLSDDPQYKAKARQWSLKMKDIHEWLVEIGTKPPECPARPVRVTYHEACHLCHGQGITRQPRELLHLVPGLELRELEESTWCCGSAGVYNITQPEMARKLLDRKMSNVEKTGAGIIASANPGCTIQLQAGLRQNGLSGLRVVHPISLLAEAYRNPSPKNEDKAPVA